MGFDFLNDDERYLYARISDLAALSRKTGVPRFSRFLNEREAMIAKSAAGSEHAKPVFYGGFDDACRTVCGFFEGTYAEEMSPEETRELFPVSSVTFTFRKFDKLSHRDFLGAILGTGLERSVLGDIFVSEERAVVFCLETALELVCGLTKIGRAGVRTEKGITGEIPRTKLETLDRTVSSLRLDRLVGACANISGERSALLIRSGLVSADFSVCPSVSCVVKEGTVISIRGYGRFRLAKIVGETKKGRVHVLLEKFV